MDFSFRNVDSVHIESVLGGHISWKFANGEVNLNGMFFETLALDDDWDATGQLTEWGVDISYGVTRSNDLVHSK